jgi:hypothetical protein
MDNSDNKRSFIKHVFSLDGDSKSEVLNICQYALLATIPILILNKTIKHFSPEIDSKKSSIEITLEIFIQIIVIFIVLLIIHRIITYLPTYSGMEYPDISIIQIVLITLMFLFSLNTSIAEKANIIILRVTDYFSGRNDSKQSKKKQSSNMTQNQQPQHAQTPSLSMQQQQQLPDYNNFYTKDTTPLVGASTPGGENNGEGFSPMMPNGLGPNLAQGGSAAIGYGEPMAANAVLGGGSFGNALW